MLVGEGCRRSAFMLVRGLHTELETARKPARCKHMIV